MAVEFAVVDKEFGTHDGSTWACVNLVLALETTDYIFSDVSIFNLLQMYSGVRGLLRRFNLQQFNRDPVKIVLVLGFPKIKVLESNYQRRKLNYLISSSGWL